MRRRQRAMMSPPDRLRRDAAGEADSPRFAHIISATQDREPSAFAASLTSNKEVPVNVPSPARAAFLVIATVLPAMPSALQAATAAYQAAIEASAPVLYYQFNEASGAAVNPGSLGA